MAIKKKEQKSSFAVLPGDFDELLYKAFTEQFLCSKYDDMFKETKAEVLGYIEASDVIEITQGEGFKTEYGSIILSERTNVKVDKDRLGEMVANGELSIAQLLACVSTFKNEDLEKTLSTSVFEEIAEKTKSPTFTFKANGEFKAKCEEQFVPETKPKEVVKVKVEPKKVEPKKVETKVETIVERAKAAALKAKTKIKSADSDLDEILGKKKAK